MNGETIARVPLAGPGSIADRLATLFEAHGDTLAKMAGAGAYIGGQTYPIADARARPPAPTLSNDPALEPPAAGIQLLDGAAIDAAEWGDPLFLVEELLPSPGLSLIGAAIKLGKTTLATQLAIAVACGDEFLGRRTRQGRVVYLALEDEGANPTMVRERLKTMGWRPDLDFILGLGDLEEEPPGDFLRDLVALHKPALVVVDMLGALLKPPEANDYKGVREVMRPVRDAIAGTTAHVCFLHHHRKARGEYGDGLIGSTAWGGAVETIIELYREPEGVGRTVATTQRYGTPIEPTGLRFDPATHESILAAQTKRLAKTAAVDQIVIDWLGGQADPQSLTAIRSAKEVRASASEIGKAVQRLAQSGMVLAVGTGDRPKYTVPNGSERFGTVYGSTVPTPYGGGNPALEPF